MLVLTRRSAETVCIGNDITITVQWTDNRRFMVGLRITTPGKKHLQKMRPGDHYTIAPGILVALIELRGNQARLGFEAPRETPIDRLEIKQRKDLNMQPRFVRGNV